MKRAIPDSRAVGCRPLAYSLSLCGTSTVRMVSMTLLRLLKYRNRPMEPSGKDLVLLLLLTDGEQHRKVESCIMHPRNNTKNDIALLKLAEPLELDGKTVSPITLPSQQANSTGKNTICCFSHPLIISILHTALAHQTASQLEKSFSEYSCTLAGIFPSGDCVVMGWGMTNENGSGSDVLMKVTVPIIADEECQEMHDAQFPGLYTIYNSMICAGYKLGGKDACGVSSTVLCSSVQ